MAAKYGKAIARSVGGRGALIPPPFDSALLLRAFGPPSNARSRAPSVTFYAFYLDVLVVELRIECNSDIVTRVVGGLTEEENDTQTAIRTGKRIVLILVNSRKLLGKVEQPGSSDIVRVIGIGTELAHTGLQYLVLVGVKTSVDRTKILGGRRQCTGVILKHIKTRIGCHVMLEKDVLAHNRSKRLVVELATNVDQEGPDLVSDALVLGGSLCEVVERGVVCRTVEGVAVDGGVDFFGDVELGFGLLMQHTLDTSSEGSPLGILFRAIPAGSGGRTLLGLSGEGHLESQIGTVGRALRGAVVHSEGVYIYTHPGDLTFTSERARGSGRCLLRVDPVAPLWLQKGLVTLIPLLPPK